MASGRLFNLRMDQITHDLIRENEIKANRFNVIANVIVLMLLVGILVVYHFHTEEEEYALTQKICYTGIVVNLLSILFYFELKPESLSLKYILMFFWAAFATAIAGLAGANETFVLLCPVIFSVCYFKPRLTVWCMGFMILMLFASKVINVLWGYIDVGLLVLEKPNQLVLIAESPDVDLLSKDWDRWKTFLQLIIWQVPSAIVGLTAIGLFLSYVAKIGLKLMIEQGKMNLDERLAQFEEYKSDIAASLLNMNEIYESLHYVLHRLCAFTGAGWATLQQISKFDDTMIAIGTASPNSEACKNCPLAGEKALKLFDSEDIFEYVSIEDDDDEEEENDDPGRIYIPETCPATALISRMLTVGGKPWGFLSLHFCDDRQKFTQDDRHVINITAELLMSAMESARLNRNLQKERDTAVSAERSKTLFFATVSHDIRTPLNAILGFTELLQNGVEDEETRKKYLDSISFSGNTLLQLINDVLDLSRLEAGQMEIQKEFCSFKTLGDNMVSAFGTLAAKKGLKIEAQYAKDMPQMEIAFHRTRQILFNLLGNAIKFTSKGGVKLVADFKKKDKKTGTLVFSVIDTGRGIAPENIPLLTKPFAQSCFQDQYMGTGLGLAICKAMLSQIGGRMDVQSELGKGSTFTVTMDNIRFSNEPVAEVETKAVEAENKPTRDFSKLSLLVVDDSKVNISVIKAMFKQIGVTNVTCAMNGKEALECLQKEKVDIVFTDWWMPELNGADLALKIRQELHLDLPIVLVTADVQASSHTEGKGISSILLKPLTVAKLREELNAFSEKYLDGKTVPAEVQK